MKTYTKIAAAGLILWIIMPIPVMILNACGTEVHTTYNIWATVLYLDGGLGAVLGLMYIQKLIARSKIVNKTNAKESLFALLPLLAILLFGLWALISSLTAKHPLAAFFGYTTMKDCMVNYFAYAGFILLGITVAGNKKATRLTADVLIAVSVLMAIIALADNDLTTKLTVNGYTNTFHYQSVFYNTNHYAYYLLMTTVLSGYLFIYENKTVNKILYILAYTLFITVLIFNNTFGAYLALLLTPVFAIIWSYINKDPKEEKINILITIAVFIVTSVIVNLKTHTIPENFIEMFADANAMGSSIIDKIDPKDVAYTGSGRGALWRLHWDVMMRFPILGVGPENVAASAHNVFLQIGSYTGLVGLLIYLSIYVIGAIRLINQRKHITKEQKAASFIVVAYLISAFFGVTMFYTAPYFYAILGVCLSGALKDLTKTPDRV